MKALEKIKDMIDFCDAVGCHRALYESLKDVEAELEELQGLTNTAIEEIEYALAKPQYADVYLNNAIRFLKDER